MKHTTLFALLLLLLGAAPATAQVESGWERYLDRTAGQEDMENEAWSDTYETLDDLAEHPLDINTATREDLAQLPFLSDGEIEAIHYYIYKNGRLRTLSELAMVAELSAEKRALLQQFVCVGTADKEPAPSLADALRHGRQTLMLTGRIPLYERAGDKNGYLGYPYKHNLRYAFNYRNLVKAGLVGAQDAGEPFFAHRNKAGYDHYSFYAMLKNRGRLRQLTLGRYRASLGLGLVMNTGFTLGKQGMLSHLGRSRGDITPHASTMQANYLQGAAATVRLAEGLDLTALASWRHIDATLNDNGAIQTIRTDGYHRTPTEMERKNNASQTTAGGRLQYRASHFHVALNTVYHHFDRPLEPADALYRQYYARGRDLWNTSVDYGLLLPRFSFNGETAIDKSGAVATIHTAAYRPVNALTLVAVQRFYSKKYAAVQARSFSEGGRVQNESGFYLGAEWQPAPRWGLSAYTDYAYFPWPRYQASRTSRAWDHLVRLSYTAGRWSAYARYRLRRRQRNNADLSALQWKNEHRARLSAEYDGGLWAARTQADLSACNFDESATGWMLSQQLRLKREHWQAAAGVGYFNTDNYDTRLYAYEPGMRYGFNFPMFYGEGIRYWLQARLQLIEAVEVSAKLATTDYFDRATIGTGLQQIDHSAQTDLDLQLRCRF